MRFLGTGPANGMSSRQDGERASRRRKTQTTRLT